MVDSVVAMVVGNKLGYLQATVEYALEHHELAEPFAAWLAEHGAMKG